MSAHLTFEGLSFRYGDKPLLQDFSASIAEGSITSIIGPNGCGKSTLVKLANGFLRPQAGVVRLRGTNVLELGSKERSRQMAVLSQGSVAPAMTVRELVSCGRFPYLGAGGRLGERDRELVDEAIAIVGLQDYCERDVRFLSGGERQRAYLALVIAQDTPLVLLDEPTTFLDIRACHRMLRLVQELNQTMGKTFLMVIHDIDLALRYSQELLVMDGAHRCQQGTRDEMLAAKAVDAAFGIEVFQHCDAGETTYTSIPRFS